MLVAWFNDHFTPQKGKWSSDGVPLSTRHKEGKIDVLTREVRSSNPPKETTVAGATPFGRRRYSVLGENAGGHSICISIPRVSFSSFPSAKDMMDPHVPMSPLRMPAPSKQSGAWQNVQSWIPSQDASSLPIEKTPASMDRHFVLPPHMMVAPAQKLEGWRLLVVEVWYVS